MKTKYTITLQSFASDELYFSRTVDSIDEVESITSELIAGMSDNLVVGVRKDTEE